jgi:hypothetical protein
MAMLLGGLWEENAKRRDRFLFVLLGEGVKVLEVRLLKGRVLGRLGFLGR